MIEIHSLFILKITLHPFSHLGHNSRGSNIVIQLHSKTMISRVKLRNGGSIISNK
jgi:hypothetical protein